MSKTEKYYIDARGDRVPARHVSSYDKKRDRIANQIAKDWQAMEERMRKLKEKTLERIEDLRNTALEDTGVKDLGGKAGYIQFRNFCGSVTVRLDNAKQTEYDERLQIAIQLIREAARDFIADVDKADLIEAINRTFEPRRSGAYDRQRIRDLQRWKVKHPKWREAMKILAKCERTIGHRRYVRVSVRTDPDSRPEPINLDISKV